MSRSSSTMRTRGDVLSDSFPIGESIRLERGEAPYGPDERRMNFVGRVRINGRPSLHRWLPSEYLMWRCSRWARAQGVGMTIVELQDVRKVYPLGKVEVEALKGVSFCIEKGDFISIAGPSGSGKT